MYAMQTGSIQYFWLNMSNGLEENSKESSWILLSIHHSLLSNFKNGWPPPTPHPLWCYSVLKRGREQENKMMQLKKWKLCLEIPIFSPFSPIYVHFLIGFYAWPNPKWEGQRCIIVVKAFSQCEKEGEKKRWNRAKKFFFCFQKLLYCSIYSKKRGEKSCWWL